MLEALLVLKTHWLLTLLIAGMLGLATAAVAKWRSMDWQARQDIWFKFLSVCICLWALLAELRDWRTHMLIDFGCWCCTQDFRGFMMNIAMFGVEVNLLFFRGLYEIHHQIRESQKQKMIDKMAVVHKSKCDVHDREMKEKNSHIEEQETQITSLNEEIGTTAGERNKYKKLYEDTYWSKFITERQCKNTVTYIRQEAQREVSISATRWASSFQARGNLANTLLDQRLQHSTYVGQATQQITELGTQLEQARAPCEEHTSRINELQGDNTALRAQLKAKDEIIEAKPKLPEISTSHIGLGQIPQDVCETVYQHLLASGWAQILEQHTRLTNERPSLMEEGLGLFTRCNNLEAQVKELQSGSSTQQDSSGKLQDLQVRFDGLNEEFKHLESDSEIDKKKISQLEERNENSRKALSKALQEKSNLDGQLQALRPSSQTNGQPAPVVQPVPVVQPPAAIHTNSELAAKIAYLTAFPNGKSKSETCRGATKGLHCLVASLRLQHDMNDVTVTHLQDICKYPMNAAQIAAARKEAPDGFEQDPHQLAKILELWSRQKHGQPAVLGVKSRVHNTQREKYMIVGDDDGQLVVWVERLVPAKDTQIPAWGAFGPKVEAVASGNT